MVDHAPTNWQLIGGGYRVSLRCPRYVAGILAQILTGWSIEQLAHDQDVTVSMTYCDGYYAVDSRVLDHPERHNDIMNAINETLVNLAYVIAQENDDTRLVHCAGFSERGQVNIVVGQKNRGKSALVYKKACEGAKIIADDLVLWRPKQGKFFALGLPLRLRRPVLTIDGQPANPDHFFAGSGIAYSKNHAFHIAPAGTPYLLDKLWELDSGFVPHPVSVLQTPTVLARYLIGPEYTTLKKVKLES
jgi:hypothetical protein